MVGNGGSGPYQTDRLAWRQDFRAAWSKRGISTPRADIDLIRRTGNVFADLGLPGADDLLAKAELARRIGLAIESRGLTQEEAARMLQVDQPKISALIRGRLAGFSLERLMRFLVLLGNDVEIVVKEPPRSGRKARLRVV